MKEEIIETLKKAISEITSEKVTVQLDVPHDIALGDYSTNVALVLSKKLGKSPREVAEILKSNIQDHISNIVDSIDVAGPGFINFFLSKEVLVKNLQKITEEKESFGNAKSLKDKKMMFEFGDPNPFKEFHIGHLYTTTIGESLSRFAESQGAEVWRVCYQGDVGLHVAKALFGLRQKLKTEDLQLKTLADAPIEDRAKLLGEAYALGAAKYEEDESAKEEINQLNKKIYDRSDEEINKLYDTGKKWSLEYFDTIYKRLGTHYEKHYFESVVGKIGLEYIKEHKDVFEEDAGAVIFPGKKHGLHNRVFINSLGLPTYEAKELGLAPTKYEDFQYDKSVIVTGAEINEYFKVLLKALSFINPDLADKTKHLGHGMVRLPEGKMSSRTGNIITGEWLLDTAKEKIQKAYPEMNETTAEMVAVAAVKYALLRSNIGNDIAFSFEESISFEGNSGPYLQYTYARTNSILEKAGAINYEPRTVNYEPEEFQLLRKLIHFPEIVSDSAQRFAPNTLSTYLFELAQDFNLFYQKVPILKGNEESKQFRLALTAATGQVIKNGLYLLGIKTPERM